MGIRITCQTCWNSDCWAPSPQFPIRLSGRGSRIGMLKIFFKYNSDLLITCVWIKHKHIQTPYFVFVTLPCFYCIHSINSYIFFRWDTNMEVLFIITQPKELACLSSQIMLILQVQGSHLEIPALNHIKTDCDRIKSEFFLWPVLCEPLWFHPLPLPLFHSTPAFQPPVGISTIPSSLNLQAFACTVSFSCNALFPDVCVDYSFYTFRCLFKYNIFRRTFPDHPI